MKRILNIAFGIIVPFAALAQNNNGFQMDEHIFNAIASILVVALFMVFIVTILKRILDNRLKNKIIDKDISENLAGSLLQTNPKENRNINIKWFVLLAGIGIGLTIINYTLPLGFHSLAIMAFCLSLSFLAYYFFVKKSEM